MKAMVKLSCILISLQTFSTTLAVYGLTLQSKYDERASPSNETSRRSVWTRGMSFKRELEIRRGQFIYLTQGAQNPPSWLCEVAKRSDTQVIWGSFKLKMNRTCAGIKSAIYMPKSTWTTGRNSLLKEAVKLQQRQGWRAEYLMLTDAESKLVVDVRAMFKLLGPDVDVMRLNPYSMLHTALSNVQPAVAAIPFNSRLLPIAFGKRNRCGDIIAPCAADVDAAFNAFHATAVPILLPYDPYFDKKSWWASQIILNELMMATMKEHVVHFNQFYIDNNDHSAYPRTSDSFDFGDRSGHGDSGSNDIAAYVRTRVSDCLRDSIGLYPQFKSAICHSCPKSSACQSSPECATGTALGAPLNYMDIIECKPFAV